MSYVVADSMYPEPVRVKQEPEGDGVGSSDARDVTTGPITDQGHIKKEPECTEAVQVKQEPWGTLYADHVFKDELVLGPEWVHRTHVKVGDAKSVAVNLCSPARDLDCGLGQFALKDCWVRLERFPCDELARSTWQERVRAGAQLALQNCWVRLERLPHHEEPVGNQLRPTADQAGHKGETGQKNTDRICNEKRDYTENDVKLKCDVCSKTFSQTTCLMKHLMTHIFEPLSPKKEYCQQVVLVKEQSEISEPKRTITAHKSPAYPATPTRVTKIYVPLNSNQKEKKQDINVDSITTNTYVCNTCGKIYQEKHCLIDHFKFHLRRKPMSNNTSNKTFSCEIRKEKQPNSKTERIKTGTLECETCKKLFKSNYNLNIHKRIHTGEKPYSCEMCKSRFTTKNSLQSHMQTHNRERPYSCDVCQKKFSQSSALKTHKRLHTGEKPYSCKVCNKVFTQSGHLTRHELVHTEIKAHSCQKCNKQFAEPGKLRIHELTHTGGKPCSCEICGKKFRQLAHLYRHKLSHTGERPYFCEICEKRFGDASHLRQHRLIHKGIKPYACKICKKKFSLSNNVKKHLRIHTGEKPYSCEICKKQCSESGALKVHMRIHSGDKPYFCEICSALFAYSSSLKAHMRYHTPDLFSCGTCSKQFARSGDLKKHERVHSG